MSLNQPTIIKWGNLKIGDDTLIFNMTSSFDCPSRKLGLCKILNNGITCYAEKPEKMYKYTLSYRQRQEKFWDTTSAEKIADYFTEQIKHRKKPTRYFRFNESGDFKSQQDVIKLSKIANELNKINVITYGYTSRRDLNFESINFIIKGSGFSAPGLNGSTTVVKKNELIPDEYISCIGDCKICNLCKFKNNINIAFKKH